VGSRFDCGCSMISTDTLLSFTIPPELAAVEPPERRGLARDEVRLLVIDRASGELHHTRFNLIGEFLTKGDVLVFNRSRTLPASLPGSLPVSDIHSGGRIEVRLAERLPDESWLALILCGDGEPTCDLRLGLEIEFGRGLSGTVLDRNDRIPRLWRIRFSQSGAELIDSIYRVGHPIKYEYVRALWDLDYYQTVYAQEPGSAEMPSAGRAFTWRLLFDLRRKGIETTQVVLHTGLSSYEDEEIDSGHPVSEEEYLVTEDAARVINLARQQRRRVIAVGTTVVRALESAVDTDGRVTARHDFTRLRITPDYALKVADGILTGLHESGASHLEMLSAFVSPALIRVAYKEAIKRRYLWHEFGDVSLIV
jgi:S-adenosylmethionine:tRNA ribosyltransferase-isomerase